MSVLNQQLLAGAVAVLPRLPTDAIQNNRQVHLRAWTDRQKRVGLQNPDCLYGTMIPEPDYSDTEQEAMMVGETKRGSRLVQHPYNDDGLIMPKKIHNPCMDSMEKQQLHRELMFNQKMGRNVLNQKTELQKALEKHKEQQVKKELENERQSTLTPFQKILEERAKKERDNSESSSSDEANNKPITENEFLKVHAKVRGRLESK